MKPLKFLLTCTVLALLSVSLADAQRIRAGAVVETGILQAEGFVPGKPASDELSLPYLIGDTVFVKSSTGLYRLTSTKTARTPVPANVVRPTSSNRQSNLLRFSSAPRYRKTATLPEPPAGYYVQGVQTDGKYVLIRPNFKYTLTTGSLTQQPSSCSTTGPSAINSNNPLSAYTTGGNFYVDADWSSGVAPFTVVIRNAANAVTYSVSITTRSIIHALVGSTGTSTLTITDANGCTASASVSTAGSTPTPTSCSGGPTTLNGNQPLTSYTFNGGQVVDLSWLAGTLPAVVTVTNPQGSISFTESSADRVVLHAPVATGTSTITVTDANGCTLNGSVTVSPPAPPTNCSGGPSAINDGNALTSYTTGNGLKVVDTNWSNGTAPFEVVVRNAANAVTYSEISGDRVTIGAIVGTVGGSTSVITVTDAAGCSATRNITVN